MRNLKRRNAIAKAIGKMSPEERADFEARASKILRVPVEFGMSRKNAERIQVAAVFLKKSLEKRRQQNER